MKLNFVKKSGPIKNQVLIKLKFMGGDADTTHPEINIIKGVTFEEKESDIVLNEVKKYKELQSILDCSRDITYDSVKESHGEEMAKLFDNVPNDPQNDYQDKCYLDSIMVFAYDEDGVKYESYV